MITPENVKKFETLQDLFAHPGWLLLVDELEFKRESIKESFTVFGTPQELITFGQGRICVYDELKGLPSMIEHALKEDKEDFDE